MVKYDHKPEKVMYMPQADGHAEVWIRKDIKECDTADEGHYWSAEECQFRTNQTKAEVEAHADELFFMHSDLQTKLTVVVQEHMDAQARTRGYDNIASACSYANSTDAVFKAEGEACVAWRDACWRYCYDVLAGVNAGQRDIPSAEELISELPILDW